MKKSEIFLQIYLPYYADDRIIFHSMIRLKNDFVISKKNWESFFSRLIFTECPKSSIAFFSSYKLKKWYHIESSSISFFDHSMISIRKFSYRQKKKYHIRIHIKIFIFDFSIKKPIFIINISFTHSRWLFLIYTSSWLNDIYKKE